MYAPVSPISSHTTARVPTPRMATKAAMPKSPTEMLDSVADMSATPAGSTSTSMANRTKMATIRRTEPNTP
ncbi:Uncharacterised protein [uncultured archaeon]|nr:Uncharacterised protein [uncultured archaeon]